MNRKFKLTLLVFITFTYKSTISQNIFRTVCKGDLEGLNKFLKNDNINIKDNRGRSLLHWAIGCRKDSVAKFLVSKNININLEDFEGKSPLFVAINFSNEKIFDVLVNSQKDREWIDIQGTKLLEKAILKESSLFVKKLFSLGVDINKTNERGNTPLEIAKLVGADKMYTLILSLGAKKSIRQLPSKAKGVYMGQDPPNLTPKIFAPNFISTEAYEFGSIFNKKGTEFFYAVDVNGKNEIRYSKRAGSMWSIPKVIITHPEFGFNDPFLSNDEMRLYFISNRPIDSLNKKKDIDIWYVNRTRNGWSAFLNAGNKINSNKNEYYISFTNEKTMYFSSNGHNNDKTDYDIYYSKYYKGEFQEPQRLNDNINTPNYEADAFVAPDESYLIFCSIRNEGFGRGDLYISFKKSDGSWSKAKNMGDTINTMGYEYCPFVTKDGKYLFYTSNQDIYWVSTKIFNQFKNKN